MTSIYDVPYEDIIMFLLANNKDFSNKDEAYNTALVLLKDKNAIGHTVYEIDNMSQKEIDQLAKLLTMKGNNPQNIKKILRYLNKLQDDNINSRIIKKNDISSKNNLDDIKILPPSNDPYLYRFNLPNDYKKLSIKDLIKVMKFLKLQDSDFIGSGKNGNLLRQDRIKIINDFIREIS